MSGMFGGSSTNAQAQEIYSGIQVSSSILGQPLPYVAGRQRVPFNLSWYGNFQVSTSNAGGGKGGGGNSNKQYSYSAAFIAALCLGPITGIFQIWHDKALETLTFENLAVAYGGAVFSGSITGTTLIVHAPVQGFVTNGVLTGNGVFVTTNVTGQLTGPAGGAGTYTVSHSQSVTLTAMFVAQPVWSGYPAGTPTAQMIPYDRLAYVASSAYNLGSSAGMPNLTFEVEGIVPGYSDANGIFDADPSAVLPNYLLDGVVGALAGYPGIPLVIGSSDAPLTGTTNSWQAYCMSMGLLTSPYEYTQRQATDFTSELLQCTNSDVFLSYGTLKVFPYCDAPVAATVAGTAFSYTPNLTPVFIFGDDDYIADEDEPPIKLHITAQSDTYNEVNVEYLDRSNYYNAAPVMCPDDDDIAKFGPRLASALSWHQITSATVARTAGQLWLQKQLREINRYEFKVRRDYSLIEPGIDFVSLNTSQPGLGLVNQLCQVESVDVGEDDDQTLTFMVIEIPGVTRSTAQFDWSGAQGYFANYASDPGPIQTPLIFQMPPMPAVVSGGITLGMAVCGETVNAFWLGCDVYASVDGGTTYQLVGRMPEACRYGKLTANLPAGSVDPDTFSTLSLVLANTNLQISTAVTHADADSMQTPILVYGGVEAEVMSFGAAALTSPGNYNLSYLRRGLYGSNNQPHSDTNEGGSGAAADFVRLDGALFQLAVDPGMAGQTINFKFVSFNSWQQYGPQTLASSTAYPYIVPSAIRLGGMWNAGGSAVAVGTSAYKASTGATAWDSSVYSQQAYTNGCSISAYPAAAPVGGVMVGLTTNPLVSNVFTNLNYALYATSADSIQIYESGALVGTFAGSYSTGTLLNVVYDGKHVAYYIAGVLVRSVPITNLTLFAQICFFSPNDGVFGIDFSPSGTAVTPFTLEPMSINVAAAGTVVKSNGLGGNIWGTKNFQSKESYSNGAILSFVVNPLGDAQFIGFSQSPAVGDPTGLVHTLAGWYPHGVSNTCQILFNGAIVGVSNPYAAAGEVFTIEYDTFFFYWYRNNTLIHQEHFTNAGALFLFGDFFEDNEGFSNVYFGPNGQLTPNPFIATGGAVTHDSTFQKASSAIAWDSSVYSLNAYEICHLQAKASDLVNHAMIGLATAPTASPSYANINYAWYNSSGTWDIYETGTPVIVGVAAVALTDLVAITYDGSTVTYLLNGAVIRTVAVAGAVFALEASFAEIGSGWNSVQFGPGTVLDTIPTISIDPNAATSISTVSVTAVTTSTGAANTITSVTVGPFPYATTVVVTATGAWSNGSTPATALTYALNTVGGNFLGSTQIQIQPLVTGQGGVFATEQTYALAANTTQTYFLCAEASGGITAFCNISQATIKAEAIKR